MEKKWNKWLIIIGLIVLILSPRAIDLLGPQGIMSLALIGAYLLVFGLLNYTNWNIWIKTIISLVVAVPLSVLFLAIYIVMFGNFSIM